MIKDREYNHKEAEKLAMDVANRIRDATKDFNIPNYKILVQTVVGEIGGQGVRIASKSLWDDKNDNWASFTYSNVRIILSYLLTFTGLLIPIHS